MTGKMGLSVLSSQPTDPSLGVLHARLHLDDPQRIHYGSDDPVDGSVRLKFERNGMKGAPATELFGPLEVNLTLKGTMRFVSGNSAISDSSPQNESVFVNKMINLHTGPFRAAPGTEHDFPFSLNFPEHADAKHKTSVSAYQDAAGNWKFRQRLSDTTIEDLPPTLTSKQKHAMVASDMSIRYGLVLQVSMPGIDVRILTPLIEREVLYDRPRVPPIAATTQSAQTTSFTQLLSVEHKSLLPPSDPHRTSSSRSLKSLFKSSPPLPKYAFNVSCTGIPQNIFIGQPITFPLCITPSDETSTTPTPTPPPEISLTNCTLSLIAHTHGKPTFASPSSEETHNTELLKEKPCDVIGFDSTTTTSTTRMGHIDVGTLSAVPSTFTHGNLRREYKLKIAIGLNCLGQNFHVTRMVGVVVHPPVIDLGDVGAEEGDDYEALDGNGVVLGEEENATPLPSYDAVVGGEGATPGYFEREPQVH